MNILDTLKAHLAERQEKLKDMTVKVKSTYADLQALTATYNAMHAEFQSLTAEVTGYQKVVEAESRIASEQSTAEEFIGPKLPIQAEAVPVVHSEAVEVNKTELIREALQRHPTGLTPGEVWLSVKDQIPSRNYVYSVLGRLKDRDQVSVNKRGKYTFRGVVKTEEVKQLQASIQ